MLATCALATLHAGAAQAEVPRCENEAQYQQVSATLRDPALRPTLGFGIYRLGEQDPGQGNIFSTHAKLELTRGPVYVAFDQRLASTQAPSGMTHEFLLGYGFQSFASDSLCDLRRTVFRFVGGTRAINLVGYRGRDFFWARR
jgi:hypothetical protein